MLEIPPIGDHVDIGWAQTANRERRSNGLVWKRANGMLPSREALLLDESDDVPVSHDRRRWVVGAVVPSV